MASGFNDAACRRSARSLAQYVRTIAANCCCCCGSLLVCELEEGSRHVADKHAERARGLRSDRDYTPDMMPECVSECVCVYV